MMTSTVSVGWRVSLASAGSALAMLTAVPALAQNMAPPEAYEPTDDNGVNLATGTISATTTQISIGQPGAGGLSYSASFDARANGWRHSTWGGIDRQPENPTEPLPGFTVTVMGQSVVFEELSAGTFGAVEGYGTLTLASGVYTFTALDGTTATFIKSQSSQEGYEANEGVIQTITRPDGEILTFTYLVGGSGPTVRRYPLSVSNNLGYQIHFQYPSGIGQRDNLTVTALNNGVDACAPTATTCTFTQSWPSLTLAAPNSSERTATDSLGRMMRLGFNGSGQLIGIADPTQSTGWSRSIGWTGAYPGRVGAVSDAVGTWVYSIPARPSGFFNTTSTVTDPNNNVTTYKFTWEAQEVQGVRPELRSITNGLGIKTDIFQDGGGVHQITYPEGDGVQVIRNERGDIEVIRRWAKPGSPSLPDQVITATYADCSTPILCGRPTSITDARGNTTDYTYAAHGGVLTATPPAPTLGADRPQTRYAYSDLNAWYFDGSSPTNRIQGSDVYRPVSVSSCAAGMVPSCVGTAAEVKTVTTYQSGSASVLSNVLPLTSTVGAGDNSLLATTTTVWDVNGDPYTIDGPLTGDTTRNFFDAMRQPLGAIGPDPDGGGPLAFPASRTTYAADGQPTLVETGTTAGQSNPDWAAFSTLQAITIAYDARRLKIAETMKDGGGTLGLTSYSYDNGGRLLCTAVRMNPAVYGSLPPTACIRSIPGAYGDDQITKNGYDAASQLTSVQEALDTPASRTTLTQTWTSNGKVDWLEDANGNRSDYTYNRWDKLVQLNFPSTTLGAHTASSTDFEAYSYDAGGNVTSKRLRSTEAIEFAYDALNRVTVKTLPGGGTTNDVFTTYDNLGRRLAVRFDDASTGDGVVWTWDALSRPLTETTYGRALTSTYDLAGRRLSLAWPSSAGGVDFAWDMADRMTQVSETGQSPSGLYLFGTYAYDNLGRRTSLTRGNGAVTSWSYVANSWNWSVTQNLASTANDVTLGFVFNPAGQAIERTTTNTAYDFTPTASLSQAYTRNGLNQYTAVGGTSQTFDARGNLTGDGSRTYVYDLENRLTSVSGAQNLTLAYDPLGRLRTVTTGGATTTWLWDGDRLVAEYDNVGALSARYAHGPGPDEPLTSWLGTTSSTRLWFHQDHQNTTIAMSDGTGAISGTVFTYSPYGEPDTPHGYGGPRFRFTGQTGLPGAPPLWHYKARAYAPGIGRFLQTDPIGYEDSLNLYAYVGNNPINATDPTGMISCPEDSRPTDCVDDGTTPQPGPDEETTEVDEIVVTARRQRRFTNGRPIRFLNYGYLEQGFRVGQSGIFPVSFTRTINQECSDGTSRRGNVLNLPALGGGRGGHTHGGADLNPLPGPEDGLMAAATGQTAYMISSRGAFAIERTASGYRVRLLSGDPLSRSEQNELRGLISEWNENNGGSSQQCTTVSD